MIVTQQTTPSKEALLALDALQKAVKNALEKKMRLGQYAVIWQDGKPKIIAPNEQHQEEASPTR
jgi:hypothetical protein